MRKQKEDPWIYISLERLCLPFQPPTYNEDTERRPMDLHLPRKVVSPSSHLLIMRIQKEDPWIYISLERLFPLPATYL